MTPIYPGWRSTRCRTTWPARSRPPGHATFVSTISGVSDARAGWERRDDRAGTAATVAHAGRLARRGVDADADRGRERDRLPLPGCDAPRHAAAVRAVPLLADAGALADGLPAASSAGAGAHLRLTLRGNSADRRDALLAAHTQSGRVPRRSLARPWLATRLRQR